MGLYKACDVAANLPWVKSRSVVAIA